MDPLPLGLPEIDKANAKRPSEAVLAILAVRASSALAAANPPLEQELRAWLKIYWHAWADLHTGAKEEVTLHHFDLNRLFSFDLAWLPALEQQIERLETVLGMSPPPRKGSAEAKAQRNWVGPPRPDTGDGR